MNGIPSATLTIPLTKIAKVAVNDIYLTVYLEDGRVVAVPVAWYPRLAYGTPQEQANVQIAPAGYGLHRPELDEDIGLEGILLGKRSTESQASLERWLTGRNL